jgi:16S rRNA A1518/A1519 N6-dimethyltransferase RsmA/KsgA/DIM1 with predicted DNA glycosylase/AP lyase activity
VAVEEDPEEHEIAALRQMVASFAACRVVEIGCGDGRLTRRYAHEAASVIAIDADAGAVARLAGTLPNVDARAIGVDELVLPPQSVDIVLFAWSL